MNKPIAVLISDVHYSLPNLALADAAIRQAISKANELQVPLIVAGDLHDTKANLRGECVNAMLDTFAIAKTAVYIMIGNHDRINEKSADHALNFLASTNRFIIDKPDDVSSEFDRDMCLIPYSHDISGLREYISMLPSGYMLIMHQGIQGSNMGDYIQDKSALSIDDVSTHRVVSGHYHARQTIDLPDGGKWDYIGNPYTVSYGEANDPPKGFQILMSDGSLEFVPTNLRKHEIFELTVLEPFLLNLVSPVDNIGNDDLIWIKVKGTKEILQTVTRDKIARHFGFTNNFRLDLIPSDTDTIPSTDTALSKSELLDSLIDSLTNTSVDRKERLKTIWKNLL